VAQVAAATHKRGWKIDSLAQEENTDRDKARGIRSRQRAIGRELRRMYDNVAKEPVPDDFLELLHKIDGAGGEGSKTST